MGTLLREPQRSKEAEGANYIVNESYIEAGDWEFIDASQPDSDGLDDIAIRQAYTTTMDKMRKAWICTEVNAEFEIKPS